ncbi:MAG: hypothetical protein AB3N64_11425 [Puniceicoccaceae bacterium]
MKKLLKTCLLLLSTAPFITPLVLADSEWEWSLEPYFATSTIDGDVGIGRRLDTNITVDTKQILENLDIGGMIHGEGHHSSGWGGTFDFAFMKLGDDISGPFDGLNEVRFKQSILEATLMRRIAGESGTWDIYVGMRRWDNELKVVLDINTSEGRPEFKGGDNWIDPIFGVRYFTPLSEKWTFVLRGDIGGLGIGSDFTLKTATAFQYRFNKTFSLDLQYYGVWVDFENGKADTGDYFKYDTVTHGLIVGLIIDF